MIKIAVVSPYKQFTENSKLIDAKLYDACLETITGKYEEIVAFAEKAEKNGFDAIISRGVTYEAIINKTNLPVVSAEASLYDLLDTLSEIKKTEPDGCRVKLFLFHLNSIFKEDDFKTRLDEIFKVNLQICKYTSLEDLDRIWDNLGDDFDVLASGAYGFERCQIRGIKGFLVKSGYKTLHMAVMEAIQIVKIRQKELLEMARLKTLLDYTYEGIIYFNENAEIEAMNLMAEKMLKINKKGYENGIFNDLKWNEKLREVLQKGVYQLELIHQLAGDTKVMINMVPIVNKGVIQGAVATFHEVDKVVKMEKKIRAEMNRKGSAAKYRTEDIIGISDAIKACKKNIKDFSYFDSNVLILGETGTGKELFAQSIHNESRRRGEAFYAINCATLPDNLLESELFGYSEGSFTGAKKGGKPGLFEMAHGGTLYLDEIGEMPLSFQIKLLRVLQEKEIRRIGDDRMTHVDVRIIAASHKNLYEEVLENRFREDLFYRINVMNLTIPPLRERRDDILYLIDYYIKLYKKKFSMAFSADISPEAQQFLKDYTWHGNVRELQNFVERLYTYFRNERLLTKEMVKKLLYDFRNPNALNLCEGKLQESVNQNIIHIIADALEKFDGNQTKAAEYLGVSRTYLWRRMRANDG